MKIAGSRVLITGAGSGIGRATALRCARSGSHVIAVDIDEEAAAKTAQECGSEAAFKRCDVSDANAVNELAETIEAERGPVDVLVNNAGVGVGGAFLDTTLEDWEWLRGVNLDGVIHGCHAFGKRMVARGRGHVVNIASGAGYNPTRSMATYCASKAAVIMLSQCLRADWWGTGVGVSVICPGLINTPIPHHARMRGSIVEKRERALRVFKFGHSPDLVAKAIVKAVERNREIVPVGFESSLVYGFSKLAPSPLRGLLARTDLP
jgi:2-hydroxycyclohexanecarboxyl-CoA dehydrogenase